MNIQTVTFQNISFINVTNPGKLEIKYLKNNFGFDTLLLDDYINKIQTPKVEVFKNYNLIVLDFPYFKGSKVNGKTNGKETNPIIDSLLKLPKATLSQVPLPLPQFPITEKQRRISSTQVDFFVGKDYLVLLHEDNLPTINEIFSLCQKTLHNRSEYMGNGSTFLSYRLIDALVDSCFPVINELTSAIDKIDKEVENYESKTTIEDISVTRRNMVYFQTMIKPVVPIFRELEEGKYKELNGNMQPFWGNVLDHLLKIWDRLEDNRELLEGISESYESYLASRTNEIVKVLTVFSTIVLPLTLFASIYGMNIRGLPAAEQPFAFNVLVLLMLGIAAFMLIVFKFKRWF